MEKLTTGGLYTFIHNSTILFRFTFLAHCRVWSDELVQIEANDYDTGSLVFEPQDLQDQNHKAGSCILTNRSNAICENHIKDIFSWNMTD